MLIFQYQWILYFKWVNYMIFKLYLNKVVIYKEKKSVQKHIILKLFPTSIIFLLAFLLFSPTDMVKFISTPLYSASWLHSLKANKGLLARPVLWCILVLSYLIWNSEKLRGSHLPVFIPHIKLHSVYIRQTIHFNKWNRYPVHKGVRIRQRMQLQWHLLAGIY